MKNEAIGLVVFGGLAACSSGTSDNPTTTDMDASANTAQVTGTLTYRERIALPPGAVAEVWLLDTSLADAPSVEIAYQEIEEPGSPPISFALEYDTSKIQEGMQYSVRARIRHADQLLFTTDTHYPVLTRGAGNTADVLLIMVDDTTN
jgi:putative lipoprotein